MQSHRRQGVNMHLPQWAPLIGRVTLNINTKGVGAQIFMNSKKSSPINGHKELQWGRTAIPRNTTVLRHCLTLILSALLTGTTLPLHAVGGTQWHVTTCNTKNCGIITHIQQHLTTNSTTSDMRALRPMGGCGRFFCPRGNNKRASVVVVEPSGTNENKTKDTGPIGVSGRANTSSMHNKCINQPHIPYLKCHGPMGPMGPPPKGPGGPCVMQPRNPQHNHHQVWG